MEHYKSRNNDYFHFTNPRDDVSQLDDDDDYDERQYYEFGDDDDDDRSCDFNFHTFHPLGITQSPPPNFQTSGVMNQNDTVTTSVEEFGKFDKGALIFQIDNTMKNISDKLLHTIEGINTKISHLEDETCKLDKCVEDVKNSAERYHGINHRKLRQMQSILEEVQDDVLFLKDKHEIAETQLQLAKVRCSRREETNVVQTNLQSVYYHPTALQTPEITLQYPQSPEITVQYPHSPQTTHQYPQFPLFTQSYQPNSFQEIASPQNHHFLNHPSQEPLNRRSEPVRWGSAEPCPTQSTQVNPSRNYKSEFHAKYMPEFATFSNMKPVELENYDYTPMAQSLPVALPTAVDVENVLDSEENGNRILENDVIDKVAGMGFRRDHVRACVRKLKENGSLVDLNSVLDKMMNNN